MNPEKGRSRFLDATAALAVPIATFVAIVVVPQFREPGRQAFAVGIGLIGLWALVAAGRKAEQSLLLSKTLQSLAAVGTLMVLLTYLPIAGYLCRPLLLPHADGNADAILVLASGVSKQGEYTYAGLQRVLHGVELLRAGRAPLLVFSTGDPLPNRPIPEAAWVASFAAFLDLPRGSYEILSGGITTTRTESRKIAQALLPRGIRRLLLVTNGPHISRAAAVFEAAGFEVLPAPVQSEKTIDNACESDFNLFSYAMHEWIGTIVYRLRGDFSRR
ncbi:MAG TPA: ElyC/SanA/YdcF family protein [Candidatus Ozemobacteraceae bacterium]|nr:ElyC/SanA/YdcF family protein [Candidatus Ozemobacteraceae bacterium]